MWLYYIYINLKDQTKLKLTFDVSKHKEIFVITLLQVSSLYKFNCYRGLFWYCSSKKNQLIIF